MKGNGMDFGKTGFNIGLLIYGFCALLQGSLIVKSISEDISSFKFTPVLIAYSVALLLVFLCNTFLLSTHKLNESLLAVPIALLITSVNKELYGLSPAVAYAFTAVFAAAAVVIALHSLVKSDALIAVSVAIVGVAALLCLGILVYYYIQAVSLEFAVIVALVAKLKAVFVVLLYNGLTHFALLVDFIVLFFAFFQLKGALKNAKKGAELPAEA